MDADLLAALARANAAAAAAVNGQSPSSSANLSGGFVPPSVQNNFTSLQQPPVLNIPSTPSGSQSLTDLLSLIPQQQRSATSLGLAPTTPQFTLPQGPSASDQVFPSSFPPPGLTADAIAALRQSAAARQTPTLPSTADLAFGDVSALQQLLTLSSRLQQLREQPVPQQTFQAPFGNNESTTAAQNLAFESLPPIAYNSRRNTMDSSQLSAFSQQTSLMNPMFQSAFSPVQRTDPMRMSNSELHAALAQFSTPTWLQSLANQRQQMAESLAQKGFHPLSNAASSSATASSSAAPQEGPVPLAYSKRRETIADIPLHRIAAHQQRQQQHQRLKVLPQRPAMAASGTSTSGLEKRPANSNDSSTVSVSASSSTTIDDDANDEIVDITSESPPPTPRELPQHPYYPTHHMRGTAIRTANGDVKRVEELGGYDFRECADMAEDQGLHMQIGIVKKLERTECGHFTRITFNVHDRRLSRKTFMSLGTSPLPIWPPKC
ncbi:Protein K04F10.1 [Aphelenchoides avenae]|nr:Protein K04F10.1 [Aphelenchus avenae]